MSHRYGTLYIVITISILTLCGCFQFQNNDPCRNVSCSGHGTCEMSEEGRPHCRCYDGYEARGRECIDRIVEEDSDIQDSDIDAEVEADTEADSEADIEVDEDEDIIVVEPPNLWSQTDIPVCWETLGFEEDKDVVRTMLQGPFSWSNPTKIRFLGWEDCLPESQGIRIAISDQMSSDHGPRPDGKAYMELDFQRENLQSHWTRCYENGLDRDDCIEIMALHEFGHILGLFYQQIVPEPLLCGEQEITGGYVLERLRDDISIMNYCSFSFDLSSGDTVEVMNAYGRFITHPFGDYNGDGLADIGYVRRDEDDLIWVVDFDLDGAADFSLVFGNSTDIPMPGDYDGDDMTELAFTREGLENLSWHIRMDRTKPDSTETIVWALNDDILVPGDYDGNGSDDLIVIRNHPTHTNWLWHFDLNLDGVREQPPVYWSWRQDFPVPGDYNGDGETDFAVVRTGEKTSQWTWIFNTDRDVSSEFEVLLGPLTGIPLSGHFNDDEVTDIVVANREAEQFRWYFDTNLDGEIDRSIRWGGSEGEPRVGDFNGDGIADLVVISRVDGILRWDFSFDLGESTEESVDFGTSDDEPI